MRSEIPRSDTRFNAGGFCRGPIVSQQDDLCGGRGGKAEIGREGSEKNISDEGAECVFHFGENQSMEVRSSMTPW